jgi:hypothetical protein
MSNKDTQFKKGKSPNPGGKPKWVKEAKEIAGARTKEAIERLVYWMRSSDPKASIPATNAILDRALGKPKEHVEHDFTQRLAEEMTDAELLDIASRRSEGTPAPESGESIDTAVH